MGKRGPKPKPRRLLELSGSWRANLNPNEPKLPLGYPARPANLTDEESLLWDSCAEMLYAVGVLTPLHGMALESLVRARAEEVQAENSIRRSGLLIKNGTQLIPNPLLSIRDRAGKKVQHFLAEFGMTPSSATRIRVDNAVANALPKPAQQIADDTRSLLDS